MKYTLSIFLFLSFNIHLNAQTTIGFTTSEQNLDLIKTNGTINLNLEIQGSEGYNSDNNINVEIFPKTDDSNILYGLTKTQGRDLIVSSVNNRTIQIKIPFDKKLLEKQKFISFELRKKGRNDNFNIGKTDHVVIITNSDENKVKPTKLSISFPHDSEKILKYDELYDDQIRIPFIVKATGKIPVQEDQIKVKIEITDFSELSEKISSFSVVGEQSSHSIIISENKDEKLFRSFIEKLSEKDKIKLTLTSLDKKTERKVEIEKEKNVLEYYLKPVISTKNEYNFYIGTNFDLKDNFQATSFYSEIEAWMPDVIENKFGFRAGIYKNNNSASTDSTSFAEPATINTVTELSGETPDSISYDIKKVRRVPLPSIENLGLYGEFLFKAHQTSTFKGYIAFHFEVIERREKYNFNDSELFNFQTVTISKDSLYNNTKLQTVLSQPREIRRKYYDSYYGIGLPMQFWNKKNDFKIFLNPVFGYGNPGLYRRVDGEIIDDNRFFGLCQFSLVENKFGIKLSGEIRKYFAYFQSPIISINISKKLNISNILSPETKD